MLLDSPKCPHCGSGRTEDCDGEGHTPTAWECKGCGEVFTSAEID